MQLECAKNTPMDYPLVLLKSKSTYRDNHAVALPNGSAAAEEGDDEHDGADDDEQPWRDCQMGLQVLLDWRPVKQERHAHTDHGQTEEL